MSPVNKQHLGLLASHYQFGQSLVALPQTVPLLEGFAAVLHVIRPQMSLGWLFELVNVKNCDDHA